MNPEKSVADMIGWLIDKQSQYRWTYVEMANISGYSVSGIKKALKDGTVKYQAIKDIVNAKNLDEEFYDFIAQNGTSLKKPKSIEDVIAQKVIEKLKPFTNMVELQDAALTKLLVKLEEMEEKITKYR